VVAGFVAVELIHEASLSSAETTHRGLEGIFIGRALKVRPSAASPHCVPGFPLLSFTRLKRSFCNNRINQPVAVTFE